MGGRMVDLKGCGIFVLLLEVYGWLRVVELVCLLVLFIVFGGSGENADKRENHLLRGIYRCLYDYLYVATRNGIC